VFRGGHRDVHHNISQLSPVGSRELRHPAAASHSAWKEDGAARSQGRSHERRDAPAVVFTSEKPNTRMKTGVALRSCLNGGYRPLPSSLPFLYVY
jgi:hypothetical protein